MVKRGNRVHTVSAIYMYIYIYIILFSVSKYKCDCTLTVVFILIETTKTVHVLNKPVLSFIREVFQR
jgi:hypothetical protein